MRDRERKVLRDQMVRGDTWMYRAIIMSAVLKSLGYRVANVMNADKEVLGGYLGRSGEELIEVLQMEVGDAH